MAKNCEYTLDDGTVLNFSEARKYVMDNIDKLTEESETLKSAYDAATKGKVEEGDKPKRKKGDTGRKAPKAGGRNRSKSSKAIPEEIRTPDVASIFNMLGEPTEPLEPTMQEAVDESAVGSGKYKESKTALDLSARLREDGKDDLADIVEAGRFYQVRNQTKAITDGLRIMAVNANDAVTLAKEGLLHPDINNVILAQRLIDKEALHTENPTAATLKEYNEAQEDYKKYGTAQAQGLSIRGALAKIIPTIKVQKIKDEFDNDVKGALGQDGNEKINNVAKEAKKIRTDVFTDIANLVSGKDIDPNTILSKYSNPRIKKALNTLVSFGEHVDKNGKKGSKLKELLDLVAQDGKIAVDATREEVRELVSEGLQRINKSLEESVQMTDAQVDKATDAFMETYEEIASWQMNRALARAYGEKTPSISKSKNPAIVKEILFGGLEGQDYQNKFATKYGLPALTLANIEKLKQLAQNVAAARNGGTFALNNANNAFNQYVNFLKSQATINPLKKYNKFTKTASYIAAYQFNNLLLRGSILSKALISNLFQTFPKIIMQMARERSISLGGSFTTIKTTITDPATNKQMEVILSPTLDNMKLGALGLSKEGRSEIEADIMNQKSKIKRTLSKIFLTGSSRAFAVTDALTIPIATAVTSRQAYGALLKDQYKKRGINPTRQDITNDINTILGRDATIISAAFAKAMDEMRNGQLWTEAGFNSTTPFPKDPGIRKLATKEARIYAETKIRMYEILSDGVTERLTQLYSDTKHGIFNPNIKDADIQEQQNEINRYIAANTREISFLGRPQGTPGQLADVLASISSSIPGLRTTTVVPLFTNAVANGFALYIKYDPLLSTLRSVKYKATGKRGLTPKETGKSYKLDFMKSMDQARLRESMFAGYAITAGLLGMLYQLRGGDDEEERRKKAAKGKGTFIATKEMEGRGLLDASGDPIKGGYIYIDGVQVYNWGVSPFYGAFSAAAALDNYDVFEIATARNTGGIRKPFVEDASLKSAIGMYAMNTLSGVMNYSSMNAQYKTLSDLMGLTQQTDKDAGGRAKETGLNVFANMIQSFVPLSGLQKDVQNAYDAYNGNPQMLALDFYDKMAINLAYVDGALRSNKTDCFGRPIEEELKAVGPFMGIDIIQFDKGKLSLPFNREYEDDPYMQMHTIHNFYPVIQSSTTIPDVTGIVTENEDQKLIDSLKEPAMRPNAPLRYDASVDRSNIDQYVKQLKSNKRIDPESVSTKGMNPEYPEYITYNLELTAEENNDANQLMGKLVKDVFDYVIDKDEKTKEDITNMSNMMLFNSDEQYKQSMTALYSVCKKIAIIKQIPEIQSQKLYVISAINALNNWDAENLKLEFPEKIREELIGVLDVISDYEDYQDETGKMSYENWLKAGKPKNDKAKKK
jgi:hypothetical protein